MAIWYTDVALAHIQGNNFPGAPGVAQIINPPTWQNNALFEAPLEVLATYTVSGTEAVGDTIYIGSLPQGVVVEPTGARVNTGLTAPATTLTVAIGDTDQGSLFSQPIPNAAAAVSAIGLPTSIQAPVWVSGTTYVPGNVVLDSSASAGVFAQNDAYICVANTSAATAPHSAATTVWYPCYARYSNSVAVNAAAANVAFASAIQFYGGPPSILPFSVTPGQLPTGYTAANLLNQQYVIQGDAWLTARILTVSAPVANTVLVFRAPIMTAN